MLVKTFLKETEERMKKAVDATRHELSGIRTGRASIALLDPIQVECYGSKCPIRQVANVSTPDARTILINPYDKAVIREIEKAIQASDLGLTPSNDGKVIRLGLPPLTEERRKELARICKKLAEEGRVKVRNVRRDGIEEIKEGEKDGDIPEDEGKHARDEIQKLTDKYIKEVDDILKEKEDEILNF